MQALVLWTEADKTAGFTNRDLATPAALVVASVLSEWQSKQSLSVSAACAANCPQRQNAAMTRIRFALASTIQVSDTAACTAYHPLASHCHFLWRQNQPVMSSSCLGHQVVRRKKLISGGDCF
jgi:hypothetical protein